MLLAASQCLASSPPPPRLTHRHMHKRRIPSMACMRMFSSFHREQREEMGGENEEEREEREGQRWEPTHPPGSRQMKEDLAGKGTGGGKARGKGEAWAVRVRSASPKVPTMVDRWSLAWSQNVVCRSFLDASLFQLTFSAWEREKPHQPACPSRDLSKHVTLLHRQPAWREGEGVGVGEVVGMSVCFWQGMAGRRQRKAA